MIGRTTSLDNQDLSWTKHANCQGIDTNEFFSEEGEKTYRNAGLLTRICNNCDVKQACINYALHNKVSGWWGNTTDFQRIKTRQTLGINAIPVVSDREYA